MDTKDETIEVDHREVTDQFSYEPRAKTLLRIGKVVSTTCFIGKDKATSELIETGDTLGFIDSQTQQKIQKLKELLQSHNGYEDEEEDEVSELIQEIKDGLIIRNEKGMELNDEIHMVDKQIKAVEDVIDAFHRQISALREIGKPLIEQRRALEQQVDKLECVLFESAYNM
jgi:chromosome segregation ATPase